MQWRSFSPREAAIAPGLENRQPLRTAGCLPKAIGRWTMLAGPTHGQSDISKPRSSVQLSATSATHAEPARTTTHS